MKKFLPLAFFLFTFSLAAQNIDSLRAALHEAQLSRKTPVIASTAAALGAAFEKSSPGDSSEWYYKIAWSGETDRIKKADAAYHVARALIFSDPSQAMDYARKGYALVHDTLNATTAGLCNLMGIHYSQHGQYDSSLYYYTIALDAAKKSRDSVVVYRVYANLGDLYSYKHDYGRALSYQLRTLAYVEAQKDSAAILRHLVNIGNTYNFMEKDSIALTYYMRVYPFLKDEESRLAGNLFNSMAVSYSDLKDTLREREFLVKSLTVKRVLNDSLGMSKTLQNIGTYYFDRGNYGVSMIYFNEGLVVAEKIGNRKGIRECSLNLGDIMEKKGDHQKALQYFLLALRIAEEDGDPGNIRNALSRMYPVYAALGNYREAFLTMERYNDLYTKMVNEESERQIADAEARYKNQQKEKENQRLRFENIVTQVDKARAEQKQNLTFVISIIAFLAVLLIGFLLLRTSRIRARAREEQAVIESQQRERIRISRDLHDNVGTQLSLISNNIDWINRPLKPLGEIEKSEKLVSVGETAKEVISTLRETIWALNKEEITFEEFSDKLKSFVQKQAQMSYSVRPVFSEQLEGPVLLGPSEALGLFRICQEAVANSFKYADGDKLEISLRASLGKYRVEIRDNGKGFDPAHVNRAMHFGLENMKSRASEVGCSFEISSGGGNGTRISLEKI
jgi:signal transduction histidine kinase